MVAVNDAASGAHDGVEDPEVSPGGVMWGVHLVDPCFPVVLWGFPAEEVDP